MPEGVGCRVEAGVEVVVVEGSVGAAFLGAEEVGLSCRIAPRLPVGIVAGVLLNAPAAVDDHLDRPDGVRQHPVHTIHAVILL